MRIENRESRIDIRTGPSVRSISYSPSVSILNSPFSIPLLILFSILTSLFSLLPQTAEAATIGKPSNLLTLNTGLVGWWTFDGPDLVPNVRDRSGQGGHGYISGQSATTTAIGKLGQAISLDGSNDYVSLGSGSTFNFSSVFSVSFWMNPRDGSSADHTIIEKGLAFGANTAYQFFVQQNAFAHSGQIYFSISNGSGSCAVESTTNFYSPNIWLFVTVTYDGSYCRIYKNGELNAESSLTVLGALQSISSPVGIGRRGDSQWYYPGLIDEVRGYNRVLTAAEIRALYNTGSARVSASPTKDANDSLQQGLVGWWTFDGPDMVPNVRDKSGQGNHGNLSGQLSTTTALGRLGQSLNFDKDDDYITLPTAVLTDGAPFTLSWWENINGDINTYNNRFRLIINGASQGFYVVRTTGTSYGYFAFGPFGGANCIKTDTLSIPAALGTWKHFMIIGTTSPSSVTPSHYRIFIDGVEQTPAAGTGFNAVGNTINRIGWGGSNSSPNARMDDVRIYNRALSVDEARRLYNQTAKNFVSVTPKSSVSNSLLNGLVGHWTFDGPDMVSNVADRSGNGNHGRLSSGFTSTTTMPGRLGQALYFPTNGSNVRTTVPQVNTAAGGKNTAAFWMKLSPTDPDTGEGPITVGTFGSGSHYTLWTGNAHSCFGFNTFNSDSFGISATGLHGRWVHVAAVFYNGVPNATDSKIYIDGVAQNLTYCAGSSSNSRTFSSTVYLGSESASYPYTDSALDDFRLYNRELTADEVRQLYEMGR